MKNTNSYNKDYRKTPEENKKRISKDPNDTFSKRLKTRVLTVGGAIVLMILGIVAIQRFSVPTIPTQAQKKEQTRKVSKKIAKKRALERSYDEVMTLGDVHTEIEDTKKAANHYFDAKTIYPRTLEPRIKLAKAYFKRCEEQRAYCIRVARELMYARHFVHEDSDPKLVKELNDLQQQLDEIYTVKDSSRLHVF